MWGWGGVPGFPAASWLLPGSHYIKCELTGSRQVHWSSYDLEARGRTPGRESVSLRVVELAVAFS